MSYRKLKAEYLFDGFNFLSADKVLIANENGLILDIIPTSEAGDYESLKGILSPGFINAHCHLELSHMKGMIPEKTGLTEFVKQIVSKRNIPQHEIDEAIKRAENEMFQNGIVAVGDISNNSNTVAVKSKSNIAWYSFIELLGWDPEKAEAAFQQAQNVRNQFHKHDLIAAFVPHAPYSVSDNLWQLMINSFKGNTISIHNQETAFENEFMEFGTGAFAELYENWYPGKNFYIPQHKKSLPSYFEKLYSAASIILVHNTFTLQSDIDFVKNHKVENQRISFCLCPNANLYIEDRLPSVDLFLQNNLAIVLGTDSLASNHQLNILEEIKTLQKHFPHISTETYLKWATSNGAKALQMENRLGCFEKNTTPGIILIENTDGQNITTSSKVRNILR